MKTKTATLKIKTKGGMEFIPLTDKLREFVSESGVKTGTITVFTKHTTACVLIQENEERLVKDLKAFLEKLVPCEAKYLHDDIHLRECPDDEPANGHSHVKSLFLKTSETIPIVQGELTIGMWQDVFLVELDSARDRQVTLQVMGT